jgi:hypothetical protein
MLAFLMSYLAAQIVSYDSDLMTANRRGLQLSASVSSLVSSAMVPATTLLVGALCMTVIDRLAAAQATTAVPSPLVVSILAFAIAILAPVPSFRLFGELAIPGWPAFFVVLTAVLGRLVRRAVEPAGAGAPAQRGLEDALHAAASRRQIIEADQKVDGRSASFRAFVSARQEQAARIRGRPIDDFLRRGPTGAWFANGCEAARIGSVLALIPLSYYLWDAVQELPDRLKWGSGLLVLLVTALLEVARWVAVAFTLGALNAVLPGRSASVKGALLSLLWLAAALIMQVAAAWSGGVTAQPWLYRFLQLFVYLVALGILLDYASVREAGGTWRRLRDLLGVANVKELSLAIIPVALALLGLVQQLASGSGVDVARSIVDGVAAVIQSGGG